MTTERPFCFQFVIDAYKARFRYHLRVMLQRSIFIPKTEDETIKVVTDPLNASLTELRASIAKLTPEAE